MDAVVILPLIPPPLTDHQGRVKAGKPSVYVNRQPRICRRVSDYVGPHSIEPGR